METNSLFKLDCFWDDCVNSKETLYLNNNNKKIISHNTALNNLAFNNYKFASNPPHNKKSINKKTEYGSSVETIYKKLDDKYPELFHNKSNVHHIDKQRIKNSIKKCLALYEDGLTKRKLTEISMEENRKRQINKELSLCTFRPKISRKKIDIELLNPYYKRIYERDLSKNHKLKKCYKSMEILNKNKQVDINPKKELRKKLNKPKKILNTKSQSCLNKKEIQKFILRYTKARDEKIIKRVKKLYKKDDSYAYYLNTLTTRIGNNEYKNFLNVNNVVPLYGERISKNGYINSYIGEFKGLSYNEDTLIKKSNKNKKLILDGIRKGLLAINLNDEIVI